MSQPNPAEHHEPDPLLAFFEEQDEAAEPPVAAKDPAAEGDVRARLERAERQIERTLIDITTLKSDLATLVNAVEDIKKRMSRPPARPPVALPRRKLSWARAIAVIVLLLTAGAALWGLASVATYDLPEPPPVETESSSAVDTRQAQPPPRLISGFAK